MGALISEEDIKPATSAAELESSPVMREDQSIPIPGEAPEMGIDELRRDVTEIKSNSFALRIDMARVSSSLKKTIIITGLAVALGIVLGITRSSSALLSSAGGVNEAPRSNDDAMVALASEVKEMRLTLKSHNDRLDRQSAKPGEATKPASVLDCAKLPADVGAVAVDFSIQFQVGSAKILPASESILDNIAKVLALARERCVLIEGHTDASGKEAKNVALSRDRADSVANYIAEKSGIERGRLVPVGKGSSHPVTGIAPGDPQNRRVVFKVVAD